MKRIMKVSAISVLAWIAVILIVSESESISVLLATKIAGFSLAYATYRLAGVFNLINDTEK